MSYKVFCTDVSLPLPLKEPDFSKLVPLVFESLDIALDFAFGRIDRRDIVWKIDGPNAFQLTKSEIERKYRAWVHSKEKTGKPF
jgi:hypothetical protein